MNRTSDSAEISAYLQSLSKRGSQSQVPAASRPQPTSASIPNRWNPAVEEDEDLSFLSENVESSNVQSEDVLSKSENLDPSPRNPFRNVVAHREDGGSDTSLRDYMRSISIEPRLSPGSSVGSCELYLNLAGLGKQQSFVASLVSIQQSIERLT